MSLLVKDTFLNGIHHYLNINLEEDPIQFTNDSGGGVTSSGVSIWMHGVFLTKLDSYNQKGVVKINARILNSVNSEINSAEAIFVKHNEYTYKNKNLFKNLNQLKNSPQHNLYKTIKFYFPMRNVVDRRFGEFKVVKPEIIKIEYEHIKETIVCKDWGIDNE